ncbi:MAG: hypothetical protein ACI9SC_001704 [Gammaproteobacteria bacterium]|jgi:hypothetical protein
MNFRSAIRVATFLMTGAILSACSQSNTKADGPDAKEFNFDSLAKTDIGIVMEVHVHEARSYLRALMGKLYKRNPRELKKSNYPGAEENIDRVFEQRHGWNFPELNGAMGIDAVKLTFSEQYKGDRVFAFIVGLTSMIMSSYGYREEFFLFDSADPQNLYNSARNIEIALWKLGHDYDINNELYLYSNSLPGEVTNLSYERLFGKLIALQDTMAVIIVGKTSRTLIKIIQRIATAVFLPVF